MSAKKYYLASGVFKFDHLTVGFPQLKEIAERWNQEDPHFASIIVRGVSETNYGIHFTYFREFEENEYYDVIKGYRKELKDLYKDAFYATDVHKSVSEDIERLHIMIVKHDALDLN